MSRRPDGAPSEASPHQSNRPAARNSQGPACLIPWRQPMNAQTSDITGFERIRKTLSWKDDGVTIDLVQKR